LLKFVLAAQLSLATCAATLGISKKSIVISFLEQEETTWEELHAALPRDDHVDFPGRVVDGCGSTLRRVAVGIKPAPECS
jgi:hypothetical protein